MRNCNTFFYRTPSVAVSQKPIAEEVQNFPCLYDKGNRAAKKKIEKRTHGLGWRMPAATMKVHKLNHKGNLDWLKKCFEHFLQRLYLEKTCYVIHSSKERSTCTIVFP